MANEWRCRQQYHFYDMVTSLKPYDSILSRLIDFTLFAAMVFGLLFASVLVYAAYNDTDSYIVETFIVLGLISACIVVVYAVLQVGESTLRCLRFVYVIYVFISYSLPSSYSESSFGVRRDALYGFHTNDNQMVFGHGGHRLIERQSIGCIIYVSSIYSLCSPFYNE